MLGSELAQYHRTDSFDKDNLSAKVSLLNLKISYASTWFKYAEYYLIEHEHSAIEGEGNEHDTFWVLFYNSLKYIEIMAKDSPALSAKIVLATYLLLNTTAQLFESISSDDSKHDEADQTCQQTILESPHPYQPGSLQRFKAEFNDTIQWMTIAFDSRCATLQPEDTVSIILPSSASGCPDVVVAQFQANFPTSPILVPGSSLIIVFSTASTYVNAQPQEKTFGFRAIVEGYTTPPYQPKVGLD